MGVNLNFAAFIKFRRPVRFQITDIQISDTQMFRYSDIQIFRYSDIQIFRYSDIQIFRYSDNGTEISDNRIAATDIR